MRTTATPHLVIGEDYHSDNRSPRIVSYSNRAELLNRRGVRSVVNPCMGKPSTNRTLQSRMRHFEPIRTMPSTWQDVDRKASKMPESLAASQRIMPIRAEPFPGEESERGSKGRGGHEVRRRHGLGPLPE